MSRLGRHQAAADAGCGEAARKAASRFRGRAWLYNLRADEEQSRAGCTVWRGCLQGRAVTLRQIGRLSRRRRSCWLATGLWMRLERSALRTAQRQRNRKRVRCVGCRISRVSQGEASWYSGTHCRPTNARA